MREAQLADASSSHRAAAHSRDSRVAVCISGLLRTFLEPQLQRGYAHMLHRPGYEYFLSSEATVDIHDARLQIVIRNQSSMHFGRYFPHRCNNVSTGRHRHINRVAMATRLVACNSMLRHAELVDGHQFTFLLRTRPDQLFVLRFPPVVKLYAEQSRGRELLLFDDWLAIAPRPFAEVLYLTPQVAFTTCASVEAWSHTCNRSLDLAQVRQLLRCPPCTPCNEMALITYFATPRLTWRTLEIEDQFCALRLERFSFAGNRSVTVSEVKYEAEAQQLRRHNCTRRSHGSLAPMR